MKLIVVAVVVLNVLLLSGCSSDEPGPRATYVVITHGAAGDSFWDVVKKGAEDAGRQYDVTIRYESDSNPTAQAQLIEQAVRDKVDGIVVSMASPEALSGAIKNATGSGIPVITINSGVERYKEFGALTHVGQSEDVAGRGAGEKLKASGVRKLLCVVHEEKNIGLEQRCDGAAQGLGGTIERLQVNPANLLEAGALIRDRLLADPTINGVLTLNQAVAPTARDAIGVAGSRARLATFDLSDDVVAAIKEGDVLFAIDQQPYLQGWLPITFLVLHEKNLSTVGGGLPINTGPGFVTKENVEQVEDFAQQGLR